MTDAAENNGNENEMLSIRDLRMLVSAQTALIIDWTIASQSSNFEKQLSCIRKAVDYISQEFTKTRQHRQGRKEDELTTDLISCLKAMGFQASHDTQYGGHCDIVVEAKNEFLWIAEAKIHGSYEWLMKGFMQLDTRYSTGLKGQDVGEIIIYIYSERVDVIMERWANYLRNNRPDVEVEDRPPGELYFLSRHKHAVSGRQFTVRHVPIALHFLPRD